jgi:hypothetical protein
MPHPLVLQLRFTRSEFRRGLGGVTVDEARRRFPPMNCLSWNLGHLAWHEQRYWLWRGQDQVLFPDIQEQFAYGAPASTPDLETMWASWHAIIRAADPWLDELTTARLAQPNEVEFQGERVTFTFGNLLQRVIYHYWYHNGENQAIRQMLGHTGLPDFVGNIDDEAPYRPEAG